MKQYATIKKEIINENKRKKLKTKFINTHSRFKWEKFVKESYPSKWIDTINPKYSNFLTKLLSKALPTLSYMRIVYPDYYEDNLCPNCNLKETDFHILHECVKYKTIRINMWEKIKMKCYEYNIHILHNWFNDNSSNIIPFVRRTPTKDFRLQPIRKRRST